MVEANKDINEDAQPQDKLTLGADQDVSFIIDALEKNFNEGMIKDRLEAYRKLKEEVSVFSLKYAKFELEHQPMIKGLPVFNKGLKFYNELNL